MADMNMNMTTNTPPMVDPALSETVTAGDAAWILSNAFLILTMQSGFGLLEAGYVNIKNVTNIMVKNVVDVCLGGITYWAFGYGVSFGEKSNLFCSWGTWFATAPNKQTMGSFYTHYVFQFSFATAATTIVSGAIAERMKFNTYMLFSVLNTFVYCFPVAWTWNSAGFLAHLGFHDFAGACVVHMGGGASAFTAAYLLGPRLGRFEPGGSERYSMHSPVTALTGTFMLWWAWLAFNCGSTFAIEGNSWKVASKVGVNTLNGSIGGGIAGIFISMIRSRAKTYDVNDIVAGVLGGLVGITAGCAVFSPAISLLVGVLGACTAIFTAPLLEWLEIDDPVGAVPVHFLAGITSTICVGLFGKSDFGEFPDGREGLAFNGKIEQLAVQCLGVLCITLWSMMSTSLLFLLFKYTVGYRVSAEDEMAGADFVEHNIKHQSMAGQMEQALVTALSNKKIDNVQHFVAKFVAKLIESDEQHVLENNDEKGFRHLRMDVTAPGPVAKVTRQLETDSPQQSPRKKPMQTGGIKDAWELSQSALDQGQGMRHLRR